MPDDPTVLSDPAPTLGPFSERRGTGRSTVLARLPPDRVVTTASEPAPAPTAGAPAGARSDRTYSPAAPSWPPHRPAPEHAALVEAAVPLAEAARRLGTSEKALYQRTLAGSMLAVRDPHGEGVRIPDFQITPEGELPGLRLILLALRRDLALVAVAGFFATPRPELPDEGGRPMSPGAWLRSGRDPVAVRALARRL